MSFWKKVNLDNIVNNHGRRLIAMCKSVGLYIMNGRCGLDRDVGMSTCKNSIMQFLPLICLTMCFDFNVKRSMPLNNSKESKLLVTKGRPTRKPKWKPKVKANFIEKLNDISIEIINLALEVVEANIEVNQNMIDDVVTDIYVHP